MQTTYVIRLAAWLPDSLDRLRVSLPAAPVQVWDYSQDRRSYDLVSAWGWQCQVLDPLSYGQELIRPEQILLDADEVWPTDAEPDANGVKGLTQIVSADGLLCWQEQRHLGTTIHKQPLSQQEQADLLSSPWTAARLLLALEQPQGLPIAESEMTLLSTLPEPLQLRGHLRQINRYLLAQESGQAWQALQRAFRLFPHDPVLAYMLSSLLAYIGQEAAFGQTQQLRLEVQDVSGISLSQMASATRLAEAATFVLPQAIEDRAQKVLAMPESYLKQKQWLAGLWQETLTWQAALPEATASASDPLYYSPLGSLTCHSLLYEAGRQPRVSPALAQALFALGRQALRQQDFEITERAWLLALSNRMAGLWKLGLLFRYLLEWLQQNLDGDLVELGCNAGQSSVLIEALRQALHQQKRFRVYDSFAGLPEASQGDGAAAIQAGSMAVSREAFEQTFAQFDQSLPDICPGWFAETLPQQLPAQVGWAYLDSDRYDSIALSLEALIPRLQAGGVLIIDDYLTHKFPGVEQACRDYLPANFTLEHHYLDPFNSLAVARCPPESVGKHSEIKPEY